MIKILDKELILYNSCTLKHFYKYEEKVAVGAIDNVQLRLLAIQQTLYWMYDNIAARRKSPVGLLEIFHKLDERFRHLATVYNIDIFSCGNDLAAARIQVKNHFDRLSASHSIIGTQIPYSKTITRKGVDVLLEGTIDLVEVYKDKQDRIVLVGTYFSFNRNLYIPGEKDFCIEAALLRIGLSKLKQDGSVSGRSLSPTHGISSTESKLYLLYNDTITSSKIDDTNVTYIDNWIWNMAYAIEHKLYYPQPSNNKCINCEFYIGCRPNNDKPELSIPSGILTKK